MKRQIVIKYRWWNSENNSTRVLKTHMEGLEESAMGRITEMMKQGFVEGELLDIVKGIEYRGYWSIEHKEG